MGNKALTVSVLFLKKNIFLVFLAVMSAGLAIFLGQPIRHFPKFVDWNTIVTLSGLLLITMGLKESGLFYLLAYRISRRIANERILVLYLIFIGSVLSMFLTNDIVLFIIVPLILSLQDISDNDFSKMIVFEAIAVNVGSALTPIGNPQNIFLWHQWKISFLAFTKELAPLLLLLSIILLIFVFFSFPSKKIKSKNFQHPPIKRKMFLLSALSLILFVFSIELNLEKYSFLIVFSLFFLFDRYVLFKTDWALIFLFIFIFIDIHLICQLKQIKNMLTYLDFSNINTLFFSGAILSQIISNVPATVLLSHYSTNYKIIAYAVNIGGNGLLISSFANLIALNFLKKESKYFVFHAYSIFFFCVTLFFAWCFLILL